MSLQKHMLWHSLEMPHQGTSNEYPQHMFSLRNQINVLLIPSDVDDGPFSPYFEWSGHNLQGVHNLSKANFPDFSLTKINFP